MALTKNLRCVENKSFLKKVSLKNSKMVHPHIWSDNWYQNFEHIAQWSLAACHFCQITDVDYDHYVKRTSCLIHADDVQTAVQQVGVNLGHIIKWIHDGIRILNESPHVPEICLIKQPSLLAFEPIWMEHVCGKYKSKELNDLEIQLMDIHDDIIEKLALFKSESSDEYSSYSDYSEDDTESSYEEEEEEEKPHRQKR